jgi:hypothetical protein
MRNLVKRAAAGAVLGGSLLVTGGLGIAHAVPPSTANDQSVDLAIGNGNVLHDLNVNVAAQIANLLCGNVNGSSSTAATAATGATAANANGTPASPMANQTTANADITAQARQVAGGQIPTTSCDSSQGVVTISHTSQNPQNEPANPPNQATANAPGQQPGGAPTTPASPLSPASPTLQPAPAG